MFGWLYYIFYRLEILIWTFAIGILVSHYFEIDLREKLLEILGELNKGGTSNSKEPKELEYPVIEEVLETDGIVTFHEKSIPSPYAVLDDLSKENNQKWIQSELTLTENYTKEHMKETRKKFASALKAASNFESIENPIHFGSTYFFFKRLRPEIPQYSLFSTTSLDIEARLVFDPNTVRFPHLDHSISEEEDEEDGRSSVNKDEDPTKGMVYIHGTWISHDGFKIAYGYTTDLQSRIMSIGVRDLKTGKDLPDVVTGCFVDYTSVTWLESRTGFFYTTQVIHDPTNPNLKYNTSTIDIDEEDAEATTTKEEDPDNNNKPTSRSSNLTKTTRSQTGNNSKEKKISNRILFHQINTNEALDFLIFETLTTHDNVIVNTHITSDSHYLLVDIFKKKRDLSCNSFWRSTTAEHAATSAIGNKVYYFDLSKFDGRHSVTLGYCYKLIDTFAYRFDYISNIEEDFWFRTNFKAPNFRIVRITLPDFSAQEDESIIELSSSRTYTSTSENEQSGGRGREGSTASSAPSVDLDSINFKCQNAWKTCLDWIPQRLDGDYLESASIAAHTVLVLKYLKNSAHEVLLYDLTQNLVQESQIPVADLPHPPHGTITGPNCNFYSSEIFYQYSSFSDPSSIYRAMVARDPFNGSIEISFHQVNSTEIPGLDKYAYETIQEFCETKRNVYVPVLRFGRRSNLDHMEPKPCIVYINGGFGMTATPMFSLPFVLFSEHCDGITVLSNIQGSGIYGSYWAANGAKENKENAIQDLQAVLKFIVSKRYTTPEQITLMGGTFNGHLIGEAIAKFPELFRSAVIVNGIFDLVQHQVYNPPIFSNLYTIAAAQAEAAARAAAAATTDDNPAASITSSNSNNNTVSLSTKNVKRQDLWKYSIWTQEFGCVLESEAELTRLVEISPLHNLQKLASNANTRLPAVLLLSDLLSHTDELNIVSCKHSLKFLAQLQRISKKVPDVEKSPILLYGLNHDHEFELSTEYFQDGHYDLNLMTSQIPDSVPNDALLAPTVEEISMMFAFIIHTLNLEWKGGM